MGGNVSNESKIGRNDPCPCGSGKKYKQCHFGAPLEDAQVTRRSLRIPAILAVLAVALAIAVGVQRDVGSAVVVLLSCALGIGGLMVLSKPPPSNPSSGAPGGINFGR